MLLSLTQPDNKITNDSIILSLILGIPISSKNPIEYIQTNPESKKLPTTNEFYSNTKNSLTTEKDLLGVITMRPIFINFKDGTKIVANYVDNLTVRKDSRKQGIAPALIQTHLYQCRRMGGNPVCFFKREGDMTAIVPLTTYETTGYFIKDIPNTKFNVPNTKLISIRKTNAQTFIDFVKLFNGYYVEALEALNSPGMEPYKRSFYIDRLSRVMEILR